GIRPPRARHGIVALQALGPGGCPRFATDWVVHYGFGRLHGRRPQPLRGTTTGTPPPMLDELLQRRPYNAAADFIDVNIARGLGDKVAFQDSERALTYLALQSQSFRFAAALRALGVRPEERIALILPDTIDYPIAFW